MMSLLRVCLFLLPGLAMLLPAKLAGQAAPETMEFCGHTLIFSEGAQQKLRSHLNAIFESPRYYNTMVGMAETYMPFVEEAFRDAGVPEDLKYLIIQESSLKADAESGSGASGFWQIKAPLALELGLQVDSKIDERRHIYRASLAAATYFKQQHGRFNNWLYAMLAYHEGPTGALVYTDTAWYGKKTLQVPGDMHWYVLKGIAHKIAYEEALQMKRPPALWLDPVSSMGAASAKELYEARGLSEEMFREYNKWILDFPRLPKGGPFTCYLPYSTEPYPGHREDPGKGAPVAAQPGETPAKPATAPAAGPGLWPAAEYIKSHPEIGHVLYDLTLDLQFGLEYLLFDGSNTLAGIAARYGCSIDDLAKWNALPPGELPAIGTVLYIRKPSKRNYYVVEPGESLGSISQKTGISVSKIQLLNGMRSGNMLLIVGQKLYMKKRRPSGEKMIILRKKEEFMQAVTEKAPPKPATAVPAPVEIPTPQPGPKVEKPDETPTVPATPQPADTLPDEKPVNDTPAPEPPASQNPAPAGQWIEHNVKPGDTLWNIASRYGTKVELIKQINKLNSNEIQIGQKLRIMAQQLPDQP